ncbi:hypothetical protein DM860_002705 [Cuscuta australis]|uniref:F-box domain-containing protein n=1 Tax=Cuscuta australis TaxID=267555 RepID=A0A328CZ10_9ASTE|nr:hypothetical protein DM860_002705 [Cuscuta australis]
MDHFSKLPLDCISEIISLTSPPDAAAFCLISKRFKSASESNALWKKFLPPDIDDLISKSPSTTIPWKKKKDLYLSLSHSPILLDRCNLSFFLERSTGKKCFMVQAAALKFIGSDSYHLPVTQYILREKTRFVKLVVLGTMYGTFDIVGKIDSQMISEETHYSSYLVFKVTSQHCPETSTLSQVRGVCRYADKESVTVAINRASRCLFHRDDNSLFYGVCFPKVRVPTARGDGWFEVEIGTFFSGGGNHGDVESHVFDISLSPGETLMVEGIEFRPENIFGGMSGLGMLFSEEK